MKRILNRLRSIIKGNSKPKLSIAVSLGIPGIFKIEVRYARDLGHKPPKEA